MAEDNSDGSPKMVAVCFFLANRYVFKKCSDCPAVDCPDRETEEAK